MNKVIFGKNDYLIRELIKDPNYKIFKNGKIKTKITKTGKVSITNTWRYLSPQNANGHISVFYKWRRLTLHRILFQKFIGELKTNFVINHKDHNPFNNKLSNLEQVSVSKNNYHRFEKHPPVIGRKKINYDIAEKIRKLYKTGNYRYIDLCKMFNLKSKSIISAIINKKIWKKHIKYVINKKNQPLWADIEKINEFYKNTPKNKVVDHIIPLNNPNVCGLHVIENFQYLTKKQNRKKYNYFDFTLENNSWKKKKN